MQKLRGQPVLAYSSVTAAQAVGVDPTTIQRAVKAGELAAEVRGTAKQSRYVILAEPLAAWAAQNGLTLRNGTHAVDPATGEVLETAAAPEPTPIERATAARARLAGVVLEEASRRAAEPEPAAKPEPVRRRAGTIDPGTGEVLEPAADSSIAADRLHLLAKLVKAGHIEAAQLVISVWKL